METQKRVPNYKVENLIKQRIPFSNYNNSITADILEGNIYTVFHWGTLIWCYNLDTNETTYSKFDYISQTTSALQGRIIRSLPSDELLSLLDTLKGKGWLRDFRRIRGMARL